VNRRATAVPTWWWAALTGVLACGYLYIGAASPVAAVRWPALAGGVLVLLALGLAARSLILALAVLVVGALVPVISAWWSLVVPLTAVLIVLCGTVAVRGVRTAARPRAAELVGDR
jgi:membrane protein implicated in regulation of membrane protease activity